MPVLRIRELRAERGYGQKATARRAGIEPARLCEIELNRGNPKLSTLAKIAGALDVEVPDLFASSGEGPTYSPGPVPQAPDLAMEEGSVAFLVKAARNDARRGDKGPIVAR